MKKPELQTPAGMLPLSQKGYPKNYLMMILRIFVLKWDFSFYCNTKHRFCQDNKKPHRNRSNQSEGIFPMKAHQNTTNALVEVKAETTPLRNRHSKRGVVK